MNIILVLIPISIVLVVAAGFALFWAINHGQFDDLDTPALSILVDDDERPEGRPEGDADPDAENRDRPDDSVRQSRRD